MSSKKGSSFGASNLFGLAFLLMGILAMVVILEIKLPVNLDKAKTAIFIAAALGSILGGFSMLFKKSESHAAPKIENIHKK